MSEKCWYSVNIDVSNALRKDYVFPTPTGAYGIWQPPALTIFSKEWLDYTASVGLSVVNAMLFYRGPHASTKDAHIDITTAKPLSITNFAINWCIGGKGSTMAWYEPKPVTNEDMQYTMAGTAYVTWPIASLKEIERVSIESQLTLVKTGIPHSIFMQEDPRWTISARTLLKDNKPWDEIVKHLRSKNLLVER